MQSTKNKERNITYLQKYEKLGGISNVCQLYESGELNGRKISSVVGVSHQAVSMDLMKYLGWKGYKNMLKNMRETKRKKDLHLDINDSTEHFKRMSTACSKNGDEAGSVKFLCMKNVLEELRSNGIAVSSCIHTTGKITHSIGDKNISLRLAVPSPSHKEYAIGIYRFKPNSSLNKKVISIYALCSHTNCKPLAIYCFKNREIGNIKSLNLRFRDLERRSIYKYALKRWDILI